MNYSSNSIKKKQKELSSLLRKTETKGLVIFFRALIIAVVFAMVTIICIVMGAIKGIIDTAPSVTLNDVTPSQYKTAIYDCNGKKLEELVASGANRIYVTIDEIPDNLKNAFVAIEDERFYEHNGIDAKGILRAIYEAVKSGFKETQGASTITQQLLKNSVFSAENEKTMLDRIKRKIQEQYLAVKLEEEIDDKNLILENYLNTINLGNNNLGVQAAALNYFNKDVSELTLSECAVIAAITQNPSKYNPIRHPEWNVKRMTTVLDYMLRLGYITQAEYDEAINDEVYDRIMNVRSAVSASSGAYSYYTDALIGEIMDDLMTQKGYTYTQAYNLVYRGGLSIYSCEDSDMQQYIEQAINDPASWNGYIEYSFNYALQIKDKDGVISRYSENTFLTYMQGIYGSSLGLNFASTDIIDTYVAEYKAHLLEETGGTVIEGSESISYSLQPQFSLVLIENGTGNIRAIVGGRGEKTQSLTLNRATSTLRQVGSTIKPLAVYSAAIDSSGYDLSTIIDDVPFYYSNGQLVRNVDKKYIGYITLRDAMAQSRNVPALKTLDDIGVMTGIRYLQNYGITSLTKNDYYLPVALGTCSATNLEMTNAYTVFPNGGELIEYKMYSKIVDHDGNVILDNTEINSTRVITEETAWLMTNALHTTLERGTLGGLASLTDIYLSAKSGTTQNMYDRWTIGFSQAYTCGVWCGYDTNKEYEEAYGNPYIDIWFNILTTVSRNHDLEGVEPEMPSTIVAVDVCADSGLLPEEGLCDCDERGSRVITEYFIAGTEPTQTCNIHTSVELCKESGDIATSDCPETETVIRILRDEIDVPEDFEYELPDMTYAITGEEETCAIHAKKKTDDNGKESDDETETASIKETGDSNK